MEHCAVSSRELGVGSLIAIGAACGVTWAAALRAWMSALAGGETVFGWFGTVGAILVPGLLIGALLGWAEHLRRRGGSRGWRWLALAPLLFAIAPMLEPGAFVALVTTGIGGGAVAVALFALVGGFALSGRGPWWEQLIAGIVALAFIGAIVATGIAVGGDRLALTGPQGAWVAVLGAGLLITLALASSIPHRAIIDRA